MKPSKVKFISKELEKKFNSLDEHDPIKKGIKKAIKNLKEEAFSGLQIPKRLFPKEYIKKFGINNLWKYDLPKAWRLIYTLNREGEVELITAILDWFDHKSYEKKFKY
ncbi:MAG: hypothetical protein ACOCUU_03420 [Nanoarchaeota archaeon]